MLPCFSDRVMVLKNGRIVEFDDPQSLLENEQSSFFDLYSQHQLMKGTK